MKWGPDMPDVVECHELLTKWYEYSSTVRNTLDHTKKDSF